MVDTTKLGLPILAASQAQKHVTMNESLYRLDTLVQLSVLDKDLTAPPGSPTEGDAYIVGASATGAWSGHDGKVAAFTTGIWFFHVPKAGWLSWVDDEDTYYSYDGTDWVEFESGGGDAGDFVSKTETTLQSISSPLIMNSATPYITFHDTDATSDHSRIIHSGNAIYIQSEGIINFTGYSATTTDVTGLKLRYNGNSENILHDNIPTAKVGNFGIGGATADTTNVLSVNGPAALFNNAGAGIQLKLNKNAVGDTASFLFQTGFSARAEIGLTGNDDFTFKVSPDGSTFYDGLKISKDDGKVSFPSDARFKRRVDLGGRFYMYTDNRWVSFNTSYGISSENHSSSMGAATEPNTSALAIGVFLKQGETLTGLDVAWRCNSGDVTDVNVRLLFHTGAFDGTWNAAGETTQTVIHSEDNIDVSNLGWLKYEPSFTDFTAPADGFLMLAMKPVGTLTATSYVYTNGHFTIITE